MGSGITVAVIDTGCDLEHKDLQNNLLEGKNFIQPHKPPIDDNSHGTHVAGTIAAAYNDYGMVGVAPETKIIPIKALDHEGSGDIENIIEGIIWATDNRVDFITMSLGSEHTSARLESAVKYAISKNVVIFCAAGNSGPNVDIMYPARYDGVISIGAIDENLERTEFTCSGDSLDFLAPGQNIVSCVPGNKYAMMSGTSMSNPFAVGCAALVASYRKAHKLSAFKNSQDYIRYFSNRSIGLKNQKFANKIRYEGHGIIVPYLSA
jgi:subtilisin family serine protease